MTSFLDIHYGYPYGCDMNSLLLFVCKIYLVWCQHDILAYKEISVIVILYLDMCILITMIP